MTTQSHVSNYSGSFDPQQSYQKFDFVYNTGNGLYYYARKNMAFGGDVSLSFSNRFTLDPAGVNGNFYIYDEYNIPEDELQVGQNITLNGSMYGSDGNYEIVSIDKDYLAEIELSSGNDFYQVLDTTTLALNWYSSSWFFKPNNGEPNEINSSNFYYNPADGGWINNMSFGGFAWGWIKIKLENQNKREFWFYVSSSGERVVDQGYWFYASNEILGVQGAQYNSFLYLDSRVEDVPDGWTEWFAYERDGYNAAFYHHGHAKWYGVFFEAGKIKFEIFSPVDLSFASTAPTQNPSSILRDGRARIGVKGASESDSIKEYEVFSDNTITISSIDNNIENNPDSWSSNLFFFDADYGSSVTFRANNYKHQYGNGYYINQPKSINNISLEVDLKFKNRTNRETNAIVHFLEQHQGQHEKDQPSNYLAYAQGISGFRWDGNSTFHPYDSTEMQTKKFICNEWSHSLNFENSNDIQIKMRNFDTSLLHKNIGMFVKPADSYSNTKAYKKNDVVYNQENKKHYYWKSENSLANKPPAKAFVENDYEAYVDNNQVLSDFYNDPTKKWQYNLRLVEGELVGSDKDYPVQSRPKSEFGESYWNRSGDYNMYTKNGWDRESGYFIDQHTEYWSREFFWKPSVGLTVSQSPRLKQISLGPGYTQIYNDGINESLLSLDLNFNNRTDEEAYAILHFLEQHYGCIPFLFSPPAPYEKTTNYVCQEWSHTYNYKNNHAISAKFEEFPFNFEAQDYDNSITPPIQKEAEISITSPFFMNSQFDSEGEVFSDEPFRARLKIKNIGDVSATILGVSLENDNFNTDFNRYKIIGQDADEVTIIVESELDGAANQVILPPEGSGHVLKNEDGTIDLFNKEIVLKKGFTDGPSGGIFFEEVEDSSIKYFQYNTGKIVKRNIDGSIAGELKTNYFVTELFIRNNKQNVLRGQQEGYLEIQYVGISNVGLTDQNLKHYLQYVEVDPENTENLIAGNLTDSEENLLTFQDHSRYFSCILKLTSATMFSPQTSTIKTYINIR